MRQLIGRIALACCASAGIYTSSAVAADDTGAIRPYLGVDVGHSKQGRDLSLAATAGLRWSNGLGIAIDATPLGVLRVGSGIYNPSGPTLDYREASMTAFAYALRADWRYAFSDGAWSITPTLGWYRSKAATRLAHSEFVSDFRIRSDGVVVGASLDRRLTQQWSASLAAKYYARTMEGDAFRAEHGITRLSLGIQYAF